MDHFFGCGCGWDCSGVVGGVSSSSSTSSSLGGDFAFTVTFFIIRGGGGGTPALATGFEARPFGLKSWLHAVRFLPWGW